MPDFRIIIPSASPLNLRGCLESILKNEPELPRKNIIVVDDGAYPTCAKEFPGILWINGIKPFVFARNINLGIKGAGSDVVLLNDDARLKTLHGFSMIEAFMRTHPEVGICSSAIEGYVGNPNQQAGQPGFRTDARVVAFVSVYIPKAVYEVVGLLDERFTAYGGDDMDYCDRIRRAGLELGIHGDSVVTHDEKLSTYRNRENSYALFQEGLRIYAEKQQKA